MPERIQRKRTKGWRMPPNTVSVTWPGKWGNYWRPGSGDDTTESVERFRLWLEGSRSRSILARLYGSLPIEAVELLSERRLRLLHDLHELRGKNLACWCPLDRPCHADVLLELANRASEK